MTAHLTDAELRAFAAGVLAPDDLLRADDHLAQCDRCRSAATVLNGLSGRITMWHEQLSDPVATHLSDDDLVLLAQGRLPADARETVLRHLNECVTCAAQADELRKWAAGPTARWHWSRAAVAAAVVLAVLVPAAMWQARSRRTAAPSSLIGLDTLAADEQARVRTALDTGTVSLPAFVDQITPTREVLMGPAARVDGFELRTPIGTGVIDDRPQFRWQPLERADGYVVTVFDEQSNIVAHSSMITATEWTPSAALVRERTYVWQVAAHRGAQTTTAPTPPSPPAKFHVVAARSADILQRLERDHPQSHMLLGILNAEAGVVDVAAAHLRQVPANDANVAAARRLLDALAR